MPNELASQIEKEYKQGLNYQKQMGFSSKWPEYERFKAGDQWPQATEKTKNLPRPTFNLIRFILNHKTSSVQNENIKMMFAPEEVPEQAEGTQTTDGQQISSDLQLAQEGSDKFTKFSDSAWENIKQDELNEDFLEDAGTSGTGILHYFWDDSVTGGITLKYKGEMTGETLDSINVFFGNPQQRNVQKQPYIIITSRDMVENVRSEAKANNIPVEDRAMIQPDKNTTDEGYDSAQKELDDSQKVTVITKYWKEQGRIYFCKVSSSVVIKPKTDTGFELYPIVIMSWEKRKKSIFGVSEVEGLIPNQKAINFIIAMMLLSVQDNAWPKILAKQGALQQQITNTPGEVITDYTSPGTGKGIEYLQPGNISQFAPLVVDKIMDLTRTLTGASEVSTGDPFTKDLNAAAIIALQNAAKVPIDQIKKRFYRAMEDVGRVWEQFFKVKYNTLRNVTVKDQDGNEIPMQFNGSQYAEVPMRLKIDIGASSSYSESLMMSSLDKFLDKQYITFPDYLEFVPQNVVPFKDRLKKIIDERQQEQALIQQNQSPDINAIMSQLTPEEQAIMQQHPEILQQVMQGQGGMPDGSMPTVQTA